MRTLTIAFTAVLPLVLAPGGAAEVREGAGYRLTEVTAGGGDATASAEGFALQGAVAPRSAPQGGGYVLLPEGVGDCACFDQIFVDGFEAGDTSAWSQP